MSKHLGDYDTSTIVYGKFTTYQPSTGAPFTLAGTPVLSVYKDNSVTQTTTGVTLTTGFDSVTGLNHFSIDTSADGTFYAAGSFFDIIITTGTVDGVSVVGSVVSSFTIRKDSALKPAIAGRTLVVDAAGLADANAVKVGPSGSGTAQTAANLSTIPGGVWDVAIASHLTAGSTGASLNAAGSAGDPWATALPGAYGAGSAGKIVGDNLNATVSSRAVPSDVPTATANADALLDRTDGVETGWTLRQALRIVLSALAGKLSGAATTAIGIRNVTDAKTRISATVDSSGNRSAVSYDKT